VPIEEEEGAVSICKEGLEEAGVQEWELGISQYWESQGKFQGNLGNLVKVLPQKTKIGGCSSVVSTCLVCARPWV
jgi:hypothetical protein